MKTLPLLALFALAQATTAVAAPTEPMPSRAVQTADLDLSTQADQKRLAHRIRRAAMAVCGEVSAVDPAGQNNVLRCRKETRREAQAQIIAAIAADQRRAVLASAN